MAMTVLTRWQPFREITSLQERVNQLFNDVFSEIASPDRSLLTSFSVAPRTDVYEEDDRVVLEMEMPGIKEEDIHLTLEGNTLSISGERKIENNRKPDRYQRVERYYGSFSRTFTLPASVDPDSVDAKYSHGILHVNMAKKANARPRQIKVNGGAKQLTANAA
jgi:HSP20 family protein